MTRQQVVEMLTPLSGINDKICLELARQYKNQRNLDAFISSLSEATTASKQRGEFSTNDVEPEQRNCQAEAWGAWMGCLRAGGESNWCYQYHLEYECNCMDGYWMGDGFCLIM